MTKIIKAAKNKNNYRHTKLGKIPADWAVKKLRDVSLKIGSGVTPTGGETVYKKSGRPFIRSQNVGWGVLLLNDIAYIDDKTHQSFSSTELKKGDVLLNITGASIGRCAVADKRIENGNVNQHVCIIRSNEVLPSFLSFFILSPKGQRLIESFQAGGNRQGLNYDQIGSFLIPIPSFAEQQKISLILSTWNKAIEKTEQLIAKKQQLKKGLMQQLLTGKVRFKEFVKLNKLRMTNLDSIPKEWSYGKFSELAEIIMGQSPDGHTYNKTGKGIPLLNGPTEFTDKYPVKIQWTTSPTKISKRGDILLCVRGSSTGRINISDDNYCIGRGIASIRPTSKADAIFLENELKYEVNKILKLTTGSTFPNIDSKSLKNRLVLIPPIVEQEKIGRALLSCDQEIGLLIKKLNWLNLEKKELMQKLLTGNVRTVI